MAYRRSIIARTKLFYQQHQRFAPSFSHISCSDRDELPAKSINRNIEIRNHFRITRNIASNSLLSRVMRSEFQTGYGLIFHRNLSVPSDFEVRHDAGDLYGAISAVGDKAVELAPVVNEAAVVVADSINYLNLIDVVQCYTGLEWWASIAATTLLMRFIHVPFQIYMLKFHTENYTTIVKPVLQFPISEVMNKDIAKAKALKDKFLDRYGRFQFLGLSGSFVGGIYIFSWVIYMAENVPSFATGGTLWFTDLTACSRTELPILVALTLWLRWEMNPVFYLEGVPHSTFLNKSIAVAAYLVAVAAGFPMAVYCYWLTTNLFSIAYGAVMMDPQVQKLLGISLRSRSADK